MSLRYVYTAQGEFKENNQVKIDYSNEQDSKLSKVEPVQEKPVETFSNNNPESRETLTGKQFLINGKWVKQCKTYDRCHNCYCPGPCYGSENKCQPTSSQMPMGN